jgi:ankyrin repeat protein
MASMDVALLESARGASPLFKACCLGKAREVRRLLSGGADVNAANEQGHTPLMAASQYGHVEVVDMVLAAEANVNAASDKGSTAFYLVSCQAPYHSAASLSLWC